MAWFVLYRDSNGEAVSIGSVVANPLPAGVLSKQITDAEGAGLTNGTKRWNAVTLTVVDVDPVISDQIREDLLTKAENALASNQNFLDDSNVTTAEAVAQVKALTRQVNALIRLQKIELLVPNTDT
jgi:hypothetical protein